MEVVDLHGLNGQCREEPAHSLGSVFALTWEPKDDVSAELEASVPCPGYGVEEASDVMAAVDSAKNEIAVALEAQFQGQERAVAEVVEKVEDGAGHAVGARADGEANTLGQLVGHAVVEALEIGQGRVGVGKGLEVGDEAIHLPMPMAKRGSPRIPLHAKVSPLEAGGEARVVAERATRVPPGPVAVRTGESGLKAELADALARESRREVLPVGTISPGPRLKGGACRSCPWTGGWGCPFEYEALRLRVSAEAFCCRCCHVSAALTPLEHRAEWTARRLGGDVSLVSSIGFSPRSG
jgi:hypothetical protein